MSHESHHLAVQAQWIDDMKAQLQKLNVLLAQVPADIDVKVAAEKTLVLTSTQEAKEVWKIVLNATKTETLI